MENVRFTLNGTIEQRSARQLPESCHAPAPAVTRACDRDQSTMQLSTQSCPREGCPTMPQPTRPRIAFLAAGFIQWTGGLDFLRLCVGGIDSVLPGATWPVLVPDDTASQRALAFAVAAKRRLFSLAGVPPPMTPPVSKDHLRDALSTADCRIDIQSYYGSPRGLSRAMRNLDAQVVLPSMMTLGPHFPHPWIGYIGDVQHKRMPGNFSRRECLDRDRSFNTLLADAPAIIVNSRSVVRDIEEFYPHPKAALFALPFCPPANPALLANIGEDVLRPYALPEKFFIISNQSWMHKSHQTAFDALRLIRDAGFADLHILCTDNLHDYRAPRYVEKLKDGVARAGLTNPPQRLSAEATLGMLKQRQTQMGQTLLEIISLVMKR